MQSKKERANQKADEYLEQKVKPVLHKMMCEMLKEKPEDPVSLLQYLFKQ